MPHTLTHEQDHNAILLTFHGNFHIPDDLSGFVPQVVDILDNVMQAQTLIHDYRDIQITLDLLMRATEYSRKVRSRVVSHHPMFLQNILISENRLLHLSLSGFKKFGIADRMSIVSTLRKAYALCQ